MDTTPQPPAPAQPLSEADGRLLHNLFALELSPFRLAEHERLPLHQILAWFAQPHVQAAFAAINALLDAGHKAAAIAHLRHTADTTTNPIERRRAATTILRALATPPMRTARPRTTPDPSSPPTPGHSRSQPRAEADTAAAGEAPSDDQSQHSPGETTPASPHHIDTSTSGPERNSARVKDERAVSQRISEPEDANSNKPSAQDDHGGPDTG